MIVRTAPTGLIGRQVLDSVIDGDEPIRVISRGPSRLSPETRERIEVVQGSHGDRDVVEHASDGADTLFWLLPPDPHATSAYEDFVGLLDHSWTGHDSVPVLGPEDQSFDAMARIMSDVLGVPVRFQQIPGENYRATMMKNGMSDAMAQGMLDLAIAKDHGINKAANRTPESTTPTNFRQWCEDVLNSAVLA